MHFICCGLDSCGVGGSVTKVGMSIMASNFDELWISTGYYKIYNWQLSNHDDRRDRSVDAVYAAQHCKGFVALQKSILESLPLTD